MKTLINFPHPFLGVLIVLLLGTLPTAPGATAATFQSLSFWETQVANACTASGPNHYGSFHRNYKDSATCNGLPLYHVTKGNGPNPWSTESFVVKNGYLRQTIELSYNSWGQMTQYRAFRDMTVSPASKGIPALILSFNSTGATWNMPYYVEEYWTDSSGTPVCFNTQQTPVTGSLNWGAVAYLGHWYGYLKDVRSSSLNPNTLHDVEVIRRQEQWGLNNIENYYYGRWVNPATGQLQGLGLVKWEWFEAGVLRNQLTLNHLDDCNAWVSCTTCPP